MGYSGRILVARIGGPYRGGAAPVLWESERKDGWRWIQFDGDAAGALAETVASTGMPALWAYIMDSDVADVEALTPGGQRWRTYLHPDVAEEFGAPPLVLSVDEVVAAALDWAAQAGLTADPGAVRAALEAVNVEVEETLAALVTALGT
uniref:hypothetical protein n=1 Tax=Paractinoplanes polyasparticus TaxID=2856853 RepID=UPI001C859827|nr:hypothetical protein [Actinoplanes polyasparticus]